MEVPRAPLLMIESLQQSFQMNPHWSEFSVTGGRNVGGLNAAKLAFKYINNSLCPALVLFYALFPWMI